MKTITTTILMCLLVLTVRAQDLKKFEGKNGKFGYVDAKGKEVIPAIYQNAFDFRDGLGIVVLNDKWGYIDNTGKKVVPLKYDELHWFAEGLAVANIGATKGELSYAFGGKYGFIDKTGKEVIPFKYDKVSSFREGLAAVNVGATRGKYGMEGGKWGFIDKSGKEVIPFIYDNAGGFSEGLAHVSLNGKAGFIDAAGKEVIALKFDKASSFNGGMAYVKVNGKCGYINKAGEAVIPLIYDDADYGFKHGLTYVSQNKMYGFIDRTGKEIVPMKYENAHSFLDGLASVKINGKWGFIDTTGNLVIPAKYDYAGFFIEGKADVKLNGKEFKILRNDKSIYEEDKQTVNNATTLHATCSIGFFDKLASGVRNKDIDAVKSTAKISLSITGYTESEKKTNRYGESYTDFRSNEKFGLRTPFIISKYDNGEVSVYRNMTQEEINFTRQELKKAETANKGWKFIGIDGLWEFWENGDVVFWFSAREIGSGSDTHICTKKHIRMK